MRFKNISLVVVMCAPVWPMASLAQEQTSTADTEARILTLDEAVTLALQHNRLVKNSVLEAQKYDFQVSTDRSRRKPQLQFAMLSGELLHSFDFTFQRGVFGTYPSARPIPGTNAKLLRVLQEQEFERLGSTRTKKVDVRIVAATHRNLEEMILQRQFRSDLYYRLNVFPIRIPALRERTEDIPLLVQYFVDQVATRMNRTIDSVPAETVAALTRYPWPGNVRELENVIERAVILSSGPVLKVSLGDLRSRIAPLEDSDRCQTLEEVERKHILATLKKTRWVISGPKGAATRLGMNRSTLTFRMKKLGIFRSLNAHVDSKTKEGVLSPFEEN